MGCCIVFRFIDEWGHNDHLSLEQLTIKTATILLLLSGERINTLSSFDIKNMIIDDIDVFLLHQNY